MLLYFLTEQQICLSVSSLLELMISAAESKYFNVHVNFTLKLLERKKNTKLHRSYTLITLEAFGCLGKLSTISAFYPYAGYGETVKSEKCTSIGWPPPVQLRRRFFSGK